MLDVDRDLWQVEGDLLEWLRQFDTLDAVERDVEAGQGTGALNHRQCC